MVRACAPHDVRDAIRHTRAIASMNEATGAARAMCVMARCRRAMERRSHRRESVHDDGDNRDCRARFGRNVR
ncbi:hypothetical protein DIJ63_30455 [Burkholderia pseudomallei]|nr:hypothetical protein DIJ62_33590 [Burkholderia pseudomallei]TPB58474.1 hypothetical protein DIJ63_30455 [Burkholderia pseudomallei]